MRIKTALLGLCLVTCSDPNDAQRVVPRSSRVALAAPVERLSPVVLVTIDGARWQDVYSSVDESLGHGGGYMPVLRDLIAHDGAIVGAPGYGRIDASGPNFVSMPGYTEIFTGRTATCRANDCGRPEQPTFLEGLAVRGAKVAVFASWEKGDAYRPDASTMEQSLAYLRESEPDVLVVSLGDTDEYAHHGNLHGYTDALTRADAFIGRIGATPATMGERGAQTSS